MTVPQPNSDIQRSVTSFIAGDRELVRGGEQQFVARLRPLVQAQSVRLDMNSIERIDAAGLAALVSLYRDGREAGHEFAIVHPSRHVARILGLVGLDRILVSEGSGEALPPQPTVDLAVAR
jgi:anti-anti-sigma factor